MNELSAAVERAVGARPVRYVPRPGGYSTADRFVVDLDDGRSVFVKSSTTPNLAAWIRREHEVYTHLAGSFIPRLEGWYDDGERPLLAIEDLSGADWEPRWNEARVRAVLDALSEVAASDPPPNTPRARVADAEVWRRWGRVAADPGPFLSLGFRDARWLERALPIMEDASESVADGDDVLHLDVRSDNLCFRDGRAILVDWNWCRIGDRRLDIAGWLPSLACEGGPQPWEVLPDAGPFAALLAGVFAAVAGLPPPETAPTVRDIQRRQLAVALDWVDRELLS